MSLSKRVLRGVLRVLYRVRVHGLERYREAGPRVLIVANHTSFLDAVLLAVFLPERPTFAIDSHIARAWWIRPLASLVTLFPMDPTNPIAVKSLVRYLREDRKAIIFPEGRITVTGSLMKVYDGPGLVADRSGAMLLPVRIDGAQYTPFSRLRGRVRLRWLPRISLTLLPPRRLSAPEGLGARARRREIGRRLTDIMTEMMFATSDYRRTLFQALLDARRIHGGGHIVVEDVQRQPLSYDQLLTRARVLGRIMARQTRPSEVVGLLLPGSVAAVVAFLGLHAGGRVPAMLNFTVGLQGLISALETAEIRVVYSARRFAELAGLSATLEALAERVRVVYLEDLREGVGLVDRLAGLLAARRPARAGGGRPGPDDPAVVLFTSGSEGTPKGVVLSHANLLANREQLAARVDFSAQDVILNALPVFHSFGLTAGTLLPLFSGMKVFFYPSPLHYRIIPELAYDINATILFGTNTFLAGYARHAHPYDFYSIRYVFAGAERLAEATRSTWAERFGVRIFEGYGATETAPVLATNTPMDHRPGSVGRLLPGVDHHLDPVPGVAGAGRLSVRGPNVMLGYLLHDRPGALIAPRTERGEGWYDTGDIVHVDEDGFLWIRGRAKRFAKVGGEMVSLAAAEALAEGLWPDRLHAVVTLPDPQKGEQLVLLTERPDADRKTLAAHARALGIGEINVPKVILPVPRIPLLGTGKTDYPAVTEIARARLLGDADGA